jgi:hypothetical protein
MTWSWARRVWPWLFVAHLVIVVLAIALYLVMMATTDPEDGVNFGAILVLMALLGMGLPWSIPVITMEQAQYETLSGTTFATAHFGPALANVVLHGLVLAVASRRRNRSLVAVSRR